MRKYATVTLEVPVIALLPDRPSPTLLPPPMTNPSTPSADLQATLEKVKEIERAVYNCCDAVQNALGTLNPDRSEREAKAVEYLKEWTPVWMWEDTFTVGEIPERLGTLQLATTLESLAAENARLKEQCKGLAEALEKYAAIENEEKKFLAGFNATKDMKDDNGIANKALSTYHSTAQDSVDYV